MPFSNIFLFLVNNFAPTPSRPPEPTVFGVDKGQRKRGGKGWGVVQYPLPNA